MSETPTQTPSDEVDERQLELARKEGDAYREALQYMADEVAHTGGTQQAGDVIVGFAQEEAEGMWRPRDGELEWVEPDEENCHLEVAVLDAADHRFVPNLTVRATLEGGDETVGPTEIPFVWHPGLHHYGKNLAVPGDGSYDVHVEIEAPSFARHDRQNGERYAEPVEVTFGGVDVKTGRS